MTDDKRWTVADYVRGALTHSRPASERVIVASVPAEARPLVTQALDELVAQGDVAFDGPKTRRTYRLIKDH